VVLSDYITELLRARLLNIVAIVNYSSYVYKIRSFCQLLITGYQHETVG
jgi:hypothetical protein